MQQVWDNEMFLTLITVALSGKKHSFINDLVKLMTAAYEQVCCWCRL